MSWSSRPAVLSAREVVTTRIASWQLEELPAPVAETAPGEAYGPGGESDDRNEAPLLESAVREAEEQALGERIRAEAFARGFEEGHAAGLEEGRAAGYEEGRQAGEAAEAMRLSASRQAAECALADLRAGEEKWAGNIEENLCALAVAIARHVLGRELQADPTGIADLVRQALTEFPIDQPLRIRINPGDLAALSSVSTPITAGREAAWVPDALIAPGGCLVEGRDRIIDGRVDAALERIYRRITYTHA